MRRCCPDDAAAQRSQLDDNVSLSTQPFVSSGSRLDTSPPVASLLARAKRSLGPTVIPERSTAKPHLRRIPHTASAPPHRLRPITTSAPIPPISLFLGLDFTVVPSLQDARPWQNVNEIATRAVSKGVAVWSFLFHQYAHPLNALSNRCDVGVTSCLGFELDDYEDDDKGENPIPSV